MNGKWREGPTSYPHPAIELPGWHHWVTPNPAHPLPAEARPSTLPRQPGQKRAIHTLPTGSTCQGHKGQYRDEDAQLSNAESFFHGDLPHN